MSITIEGVPEFLTRDQYLSIFRAAGFEPEQIVEMRMAFDGVHVLILATDDDGQRVYNPNTDRWNKHRVFIPVRREPDDERTTRVTPVKDRPVEQTREH